MRHLTLTLTLTLSLRLTLTSLQELGEQVEVRRVLVARDELQQERVTRQAGERAWLRARVRVRVGVRVRVKVRLWLWLWLS